MIFDDQFERQDSYFAGTPLAASGLPSEAELKLLEPYSPCMYDRAAPLLVRAPGRVPAGVVREAPVSFTAFARTAASLLGVRPPAGARGGEDLAARRS
jgi:microcin C transport system substrate-binding protein